MSALGGNDLAAGSTNVRVDVERLPEVVDRARARPHADFEKDADIWLKNRAKGIEEPAMRVDLPLVLFLEAEYYLHGVDALLWALDLVRLRDRDRVAEYETEKIIIDLAGTYSEWCTRIYARQPVCC